MAIEVNNMDEQQGTENTVPAEDTFATEQNNVAQKGSANGLSSEEQNDPNKIVVTITDGSTPIVILFGPPACGKTMTLIRLTRYLISQGYTVEPIRSFRPSTDVHYQEMCDGFNAMINNNDAATSTNRISFMLVAVRKNGKPLCQILEAPGEYYFNGDPNTPFPTYVNAIIRSNNRKIWTIFVEPNWSDATPRANYVTKIGDLKKSMYVRDKTVFLYNKVDKSGLVYGPGQVNVPQAIRQVENEYPRIFAYFENQNPVTKYFKKYNCDFVPFQTGFYNRSSSGFTYTEGHEIYPRMLWNLLLKNIKG
jgi:DNA polymerase III delta prime subunit